MMLHDFNKKIVDLKAIREHYIEIHISRFKIDLCMFYDTVCCGGMVLGTHTHISPPRLFKLRVKRQFLSSTFSYCENDLN